MTCIPTYQGLLVPELCEGYLTLMKNVKGELRQKDYCMAVRRIRSCVDIETCTDCLFVDRLDNDIFKEWKNEK